MLIVMIEHILLAIKMLLQNMIRDEPTWIASLKYQERQEADSIKKRLDQKQEEYEANGGVLLEEQVK